VPSSKPIYKKGEVLIYTADGDILPKKSIKKEGDFYFGVTMDFAGD